MKTKILLLTTLSFTLFACNTSTTTNEELLVEQEILTEENNHEHEAVVLNKGEKWKVVEDMLIFIRNMEEAVAKFDGEQSEDYTALAKTIDENIIELTSSCTMEGQAHDELHKWLVPFIGLSEQFDVATELEEQEKYMKLSKHLLLNLTLISNEK